MATNVDLGCDSVCDKCTYRVVRVLDINEDEAGMFFDIAEEDDDDEEAESGDFSVVHEVCALLHVDLSFDVRHCSAFKLKCDDKHLIDPKILQDI